jgi:hypothetical protein
MEPESVDTLLTTIRDQLRNLPEVNTAAKLRALVGRVESAAHGQNGLVDAVTQLEAAANRALDADPWVRLHRAAAKLLSAINQPL